MSLEDNARRELDVRDTKLKDTLRAEFGAQQKSFRGEMRLMFVLFFAANQAIVHFTTGLQVAAGAGAFVAAINLVPRFLTFLNR